MKTKTVIFKEIAEDVIMVLCGFMVFFLHSDTARWIFLILLIIVAIYAGLERILRVYTHAARVKEMKEENKRMKELWATAENRLKQAEAALAEKPVLPALSDDLQSDIQAVEQFLSATQGNVLLPNSYRLFFKQVADLQVAEKNLKALKQKVSDPLQEKIKEVRMPLSEEDRLRLLQELIRYAFLMLDFIDSYHYSTNHTPEQRLGLTLAFEEISAEEAASKGKTVSMMPDETPRHIRALSTAVDSIFPKERLVLFAGYKL